MRGEGEGRGGGHVGPSLRCVALRCVEALLLLLGPPSPLQLFPSPAIPCLFVSPLGPPSPDSSFALYSRLTTSPPSPPNSNSPPRQDPSPRSASTLPWGTPRSVRLVSHRTCSPSRHHNPDPMRMLVMFPPSCPCLRCLLELACTKKVQVDVSLTSETSSAPCPTTASRPWTDSSWTGCTFTRT